MAITDKDIHIIDKYLRGKLDSEEDVYFQERKMDLEFAEEIKLKADLFAVYQNMEMEEGKKLLKAKEVEINTPQSKLKSNKSPIKWILLACIIIIGSLVLWYLMTNSKNTQVLYASYYMPYPNVVTPIDRSNEGEKTAFQLYEEGEYQDAISLFDAMKIDENQKFYFGLSLLANENVEESVLIFKNIVDSNSRYQEAAQWYLALSYLYLNEVVSSKKQLNEIIRNSKHPFGAKARSLLKEMKEK